jgi:hypothetical protein
VRAIFDAGWQGFVNNRFTFGHSIYVKTPSADASAASFVVSKPEEVAHNGNNQRMGIFAATGLHLPHILIS